MEISSVSQWSDHWLYCKHSYIICNHFIVIITLYQVYYNDTDQTTAIDCDISTLSCSATINNLEPFTPYIIEVSCSTGAGDGPRTNSTHVNTTIGSEFINVAGPKNKPLCRITVLLLNMISYVHISWHKDKTVMYVQVK